MENLARSVDKEEKTCVLLIIRAYLLECITYEANIAYFYLLLALQANLAAKVGE